MDQVVQRGEATPGFRVSEPGRLQAKTTVGGLIPGEHYRFQQAHPQRIDRQRFLRNLIQGQPISHANLRLAHLLLYGRITNLVVTPNFDDFISRALLLFGKQHVICDHPKTVERIDPEERTDIQIIHVHGTYWFYDCCNLTDEIEDRAHDAEDSYSMRFLLDQILYSRSPIVIGYSGWEGDVIMRALERRLKQAYLPRRVYWFCYQRENIDSLPNWLTSHKDVYFVVPHEDISSKNIVERDVAEVSGQINADELSAKAMMISQAKLIKPSLPSQVVFDALIKGLDLESPEILSDPLGFFAKQFRQTLLKSEIGEQESDLYFIESVIERIERARRTEKETETIQQIEAFLEKVRDAIRRSQYREAIEIGSTFSEIGELSDNQLRELLNAISSAALMLTEDVEVRLKGHNLVLATAGILSARSGNDLPIREKVATALVNKGVDLGALNRYEEEIALYDEVIGQFGNATESSLLEQVALALFNKAVTLGELGRKEQSVLVYDDLIRRFDGAGFPQAPVAVAVGLFNKGNMLADLNRKSEALDTYDLIKRRYEDSPIPALRLQVAKAMANQGFQLSSINRNKEALLIYDDVLARFDEEEHQEYRDIIARTLLNKGVSLTALKRPEEASEVYNDLISRFGNEASPTLDDVIAKALVNNGVALGVLKQDEKATTAFDEVVTRYGSSNNSVLQEMVALSLVNKGFDLSTSKQFDEALAAYNDVIDKYSGSTESSLRWQVAKALNNKSVVLSLTNKNEEALAVYDEVVNRFKESTELRLREVVAKAFMGKASALDAMNRKEEALSIYDEMQEFFAQPRDPSLRLLLAQAEVNKGANLADLDRYEEAIEVYDQVIKQILEENEPPYEPTLISAYVNKGIALNAMNCVEQATAIYNRVIEQCGQSDEPAIRENVAHALNGIAFQKICKAKELWSDGDELQAREYLMEASEELNAASERKPAEPYILGNQSYIAFLLGKKDEASKLLSEAIRLGGEKIREAELKDTYISPLPIDEEFRYLIQSIP